jgi:hypothetical protein
MGVEKVLAGALTLLIGCARPPEVHGPWPDPRVCPICGGKGYWIVSMDVAVRQPAGLRCVRCGNRYEPPGGHRVR